MSFVDEIILGSIFVTSAYFLLGRSESGIEVRVVEFD
jgi:hypothetical protein